MIKCSFQVIGRNFLSRSALVGLCIFLFPLIAGAQDFFGNFGQEAKVRVSAAINGDSQGGYLLLVRADIDPGWHIYSMTQGPGGPVPTKIELSLPEGVEAATSFVVVPEPERKKEAAFPDLVVEVHAGSVVWAARLRVAPSMAVSSLLIKGSLFSQPCRDDACLPPQRQNFVARWTGEAFVPQNVLAELIRKLDSSHGQQARGGETTAETNGVGLSQPPEASSETAVPRPSAEGPSPPQPVGATRQADGLEWLPFSLDLFQQLVGPEFDPEELRATSSPARSGRWELLTFMGLGFLGGIILNVMPCVLPVIGLKLLAFVHQAGESRLKAFWLNVWYTLGLLSVFALLAGLAITLQFGWGHLFKLPMFNVVMAAIVFTMALAFLGVWTIPIPGFVGSGKAVELAEKEGIPGAFFKGVFTTVLATPCTGPFMGSALAWSFTQPPATVFLVFMSVGLGMAFPYLVVGAFPELIRFLPKPGAWMETFERLMGFVLLGTVVFIFTFLDWPYVVPTVGLLFALWAACWWIERATLTGNSLRKLRAWGESLAFVVAIWIILFPGVTLGNRRIGGLLSVMEERFQQRAFQIVALTGQHNTSKPGLPGGAAGFASGGYTVMVDCTADWCLTCKTLEATVLQTEKVKKVIRDNRVILLKADWTHAAPEVTQFLDWLGFRQVPVLAIFPADRPNQPIIFTGGYTQGSVVEAIQKAGPSRR